MKITTSDYNTLKAYHQAWCEENGLSKEVYQVAGLSMMRFRWDMFTGQDQSALKFSCDVLYEYLNDDHIDTALRKITGTK